MAGGRLCWGLAGLAAALGSACGTTTIVQPALPPVPVSTWAGSICGALGSWSQAVASLPSGLQNTGAIDQPKAKAELTSFLEGVVISTNSMLDQVRSAGVPAVDNGPKLASEVLAGLQHVGDTFIQARARAEALPLGENQRAALAAELQDVIAALNRAGNDATATFDRALRRYGTAALGVAFRTQPVCAALSATPTPGP